MGKCSTTTGSSVVKCQVKFFIPGVLCILCSGQVPLQAKTAPATITATTQQQQQQKQLHPKNLLSTFAVAAAIAVASLSPSPSPLATLPTFALGNKKNKKKNKIVFCALAFCSRVCLLLLRIRQSYLRRVVQTEITKTTTTQFTIKITRALRQKYLQDTHTHTYVHVQAQYAQNSTKMQHITAVKSFTIQP